MQELGGGPRRASWKAKAALKGRRERVRTFVDDDTDESPKKIRVKQHPMLASVVPGHVWRTEAFKFDPRDFAVEHEGLKERIIDEAVQRRSLSRWTADPSAPVVYGVTGSPDDVHAAYFAAYLVDLHIKAVGPTARVFWERVYGGFDNPLMERDLRIMQPTLLVLSNLSKDSTQTKLEKARDLLDRFSEVPRIVVASGEDPISFVAMRLHSPINNLAYFPAATVRRKLEVL